MLYYLKSSFTSSHQDFKFYNSLQLWTIGLAEIACAKPFCLNSSLLRAADKIMFGCGIRAEMRSFSHLSVGDSQKLSQAQ